jgi:hypothetical protein
MNQLKELEYRYKLEYETYLNEMDRYTELLLKYNETLEWNRMVAYYAKHENPYEYYEKGGTKCLALYPMPSIPLEPEFKLHPSDINLYEYYNIKKFTKSWMLNVSPNWKGCVITREMLNFFIAVIETFYDNCDRFTKMSYVLENGHGKDHLHAHIVFELNTKKPGYMTPIKKGKILTEFRNCWNRLIKDNSSMNNLTIDDEWLDPEGTYCTKRKRKIGLVDERCALNTCLLTSPEMLQDKLDYLVEELKPE